ncbi:MAG: hypothetical protein ACRDTE_11000 [Pseudonocardiaceae bacterium]
MAMTGKRRRRPTPPRVVIRYRDTAAGPHARKQALPIDAAPGEVIDRRQAAAMVAANTELPPARVSIIDIVVNTATRSPR